MTLDIVLDLLDASELGKELAQRATGIWDVIVDSRAGLEEVLVALQVRVPLLEQRLELLRDRGVESDGQKLDRG